MDKIIDKFQIGDNIKLTNKNHKLFNNKGYITRISAFNSNKYLILLNDNVHEIIVEKSETNLC